MLRVNDQQKLELITLQTKGKGINDIAAQRNNNQDKLDHRKIDMSNLRNQPQEHPKKMKTVQFVSDEEQQPI